MNKRVLARRAASGLVLSLLLVAAAGAQQNKSASPPSSSQGYTVGILPFSDLSANPDLGQLSSVLPALMQNSLLQHTSLTPRQIQPANANGAPGAAPGQVVDVPYAAQLGQYYGTNLVISGTLLSGEVTTKQGTFNGGALGGFQIGGNSNSQSSTVVIQATLVDVGRALNLGTFRATGKDQETHIDPNVSTNYGTMNMQSGQFQNTSLGKATRKALDDLTRQIMAALKNFTPADSTAVSAANANATGSAPQQVQAPPPSQSQVLVFGDKDLFGTQYANGVDPTAGTQLDGLTPGQVTMSSGTYYYAHGFAPGLGDLGGQSDYPGTDQPYVGSAITDVQSPTLRGPQIISMDYSSQVPAGQQVAGLTLGMAVTGFDSTDTRDTYTAWINGQVNRPLSQELNSLRQGGQMTQFFTTGIDPKLLRPGNSLSLQIDASGDWAGPWAIDFLTIGVTTEPIPGAQSGSVGAVMGATASQSGVMPAAQQGNAGAANSTASAPQGSQGSGAGNSSSKCALVLRVMLLSDMSVIKSGYTVSMDGRDITRLVQNGVLRIEGPPPQFDLHIHFASSPVKPGQAADYDNGMSIGCGQSASVTNMALTIDSKGNGTFNFLQQ